MVPATNLKSFLTSQTKERAARAELREFHAGDRDDVPLVEEIKRDQHDVVWDQEMQIDDVKSQIRRDGQAVSLDEQSESPRFENVPRAFASVVVNLNKSAGKLSSHSSNG